MCAFGLAFAVFGEETVHAMAKEPPAGMRLGDIPFDTYMLNRAEILSLGSGCDCPKEQEVMPIYTNICRALHTCVDSWVPHTYDSHALAIGKECRVYNWNGIAYGYKATDTSDGHSVTLGYGARSSGGCHQVAVGAGALAEGPGGMATAIGALAHATESAVAFGFKARAEGEGATAFGAQSVAIGSYSIAYGKGAHAEASNAIQFGRGTNKKPNSVQFFDKQVDFYETCPYFELPIDVDATDMVIEASTNGFETVLFSYSTTSGQSDLSRFEVYFNYTNVLYRKRDTFSVFKDVDGDRDGVFQIIFCVNGRFVDGGTGWCREDNKKLLWRYSQHYINDEIVGWRYIYPNVWHPQLPDYTKRHMPLSNKIRSIMDWGHGVENENDSLFVMASSSENSNDFKKQMDEKIFIDPYGVIGMHFKIGGTFTRGELMRKYPKVLPMLNALKNLQ